MSEYKIYVSKADGTKLWEGLVPAEYIEFEGRHVTIHLLLEQLSARMLDELLWVAHGARPKSDTDDEVIATAERAVKALKLIEALTEKPQPVGPPTGEYTTGTYQLLRNVHSPEDCAGHACVTHNPSEHSMRSFPTHWRSGGFGDIKPPHMERICPHGIGHPDPDDAAYLKSVGEDVGVHGCDGCCR